MVTLNLVFHVTAAVAFLGLALLWTRSRAREKLAAELMARRWGPPRVVVDWPQQFLVRFTAAFQIPLEETGSAAPQRDEPAKIAPGPWVSLHCSCGIRGVRLTAGPPWQVEVSVAQCPDDAPQWAHRLAEALGGRIQATIKAG